MIDPKQYGVSFSIKQCKAFGINPKETLQWLIRDAGFRRFRLMSYWNEHEKSPGHYDFKELDWQVKMIEKAGGEITLCLGARQPRWPENHWPTWAWEETNDVRTDALYAFIGQVVRRYKNNPVIVGYQLENEALLKKFGRNPEVDRRRLRQEYHLIKSLDPDRPVAMSTSNGWGIPLRQPIPDAIGFSYYPIMFMHGKYTKTIQRPWLHRLRRQLINRLWRRDVFIHELQLEPWGPTAIWKMPLQEQARSMNPQQITRNIRQSRSIEAYPVDLWGAEWWYWRLKKHRDPSIWEAVRAAIVAK